MSLPGFFSNFDALDLPIPDHMAKTYAIRSERGLMVVFEILEDIAIPPHTHKGQWGTVLEGELHLTMNGETKVFRPGESYTIPEGAEHAAAAPAGTKLIDVFEEPDRYPLKP